MDWPRCEDCGELLCPSGKGKWECIEKHAVLKRQREEGTGGRTEEGISFENIRRASRLLDEADDRRP